MENGRGDNAKLPGQRQDPVIFLNLITRGLITRPHAQSAASVVAFEVVLGAVGLLPPLLLCAPNQRTLPAEG